MYIYEREVQFSQGGAVLPLNLVPETSSLKIFLAKDTRVTLHELQLALSPLEYAKKYVMHSEAVRKLDASSNADITELFVDLGIETQINYTLDLYSGNTNVAVHSVKKEYTYKLNSMLMKDGVKLTNPGQILLKMKELQKDMYYIDADEKWGKKSILEINQIRNVKYKAVDKNGDEFFVKFVFLPQIAKLHIPRMKAPPMDYYHLNEAMGVIFFNPVNGPLMFADIGKYLRHDQSPDDLETMPDEVSGIAKLLNRDNIASKRLISYLKPPEDPYLQPLSVYMNSIEKNYYVDVKKPFFMYVSTPVFKLMEQSPFWGKIISREMTENPFKRKKWRGVHDAHADTNLNVITTIMERMGMKMHTLLLPKTRSPGIKIYTNTKWIGKKLKVNVTSQIKTKPAFTKNMKLPITVPTGESDNKTDIVVFRKEDMLNTLTTDYTAETLPPFDPAKIEMNRSELNTVYAVYNEYLKKLYYTPNNEHVPLLGICVANRLFESKEEEGRTIRHKYESIITQPISSHISDGAHVSSLDFLIKTVGGRSRPADTLHMPAKNVLFEIANPLTESVMELVDSRTILVSAETSSVVNNPTDATVKDWDLLMHMKRHLANGRSIYCQLKGMVFPTKIKKDISMLIISVNGWTFNAISYVNGIPTRALGFVILNKVENFQALVNDNLLQSVTFSTSKDAGISKPFQVNDVDDLKNFSIEIRDQNNTLVALPDGKYPIFMLQFTFA